MYDYRRMSREERRKVVELRRTRGFPLHKPPHRDFGPGWYFMSAATFEHRCHFNAANELTALQDRLLEALDDARIPCWGWVVMPNHYQVLVEVEKPQIFGKAIGPVHGRSAHYANRRDNTPRRQVWYKFADRKVRSERHFWTCLHYIIMNGVKHGFADDFLDWPWSCVHELIAQRGQLHVDELRLNYPLLDFGKGWDD